MKMNIEKILADHNKALVLTLLLTFIYQLILSFQGFDLCDEGYALTAYQQIFKNPTSVEYNFFFYLNNIAGGVWNIIFGFGGILSFRILAIIVIVLTIYFTCLNLKGFINPLMIPVATMMMLLLKTYGSMVFTHNHLTSLLVAITVYFLIQGLNSNRRWYVFFAALFCAVNIFSRIPNITLIALSLLLFIDYYYNRNKRLLGRNILISILGFTTGTGIVILIMFLLGHIDIFFHTVFDNLFNVAISEDNSHNLGKMSNFYFLTYHDIFKYLAIFVFTFSFFPFIYRFHKQKWLKIIIILLFSYIIIKFSLFTFSNDKYYAIILFPLILSCYFDRKNKLIILLNAASLIVMFFLPLGSDLGIMNMGGNSVWLATFTSAAHVYRFIHYKMKNNNDSYRLFFIVLYLLYGAYGLYIVSKNAYFDRGFRWEKRFRAKNDKFTVFTTEEKAKAMDELLSELGKYVHSGDYLFCFASIPTVHYLTETKPYTGNSWPWIYDSDVFISNLKKSVETITLPVVVRQTFLIDEGYWKEQSIIDQTNPSFTYLYKEKSIKFFEKFLEENHYTVIWENEFFQIYIPQ